jgi:hypothetical protein
MRTDDELDVLVKAASELVGPAIVWAAVSRHLGPVPGTPLELVPSRLAAAVDALKTELRRLMQPH